MNYLKICLVVVIIFLLIPPYTTQADYQIAPNPNPIGSTVYVTASDAVNLTTNGVFQNYGTITNIGTITNFGWLGNSTSYLWNSNSALETYVGAISNYGTLNNYLGISNSGIMDNFGTLNNYAGASLNTSTGAMLNNYGKINNHGSLTENSGGLKNYGTLDNNHTLTNAGHLLNYGTLNSYAGSSLNNTRELQNYDTMNIYGTFANSDNYARVINAGTLNIYGTYTQTAGRTVNTGSMMAKSLTIDGGKLDGTGIISSNVLIGSVASLNPGLDGPPVGTLTINGSLVSSGTLFFDIRLDAFGLGNGGFDVLNINGDVTFIGGTINIDFLDGGLCTQIGNKGSNWTFYYDLLKANSISGWETLDFAINGLPAGLLDWNFNDIDGGKQLVITGYTAVPLPGAIFLLAPVLFVIGVIKRKKTHGLSKDQ